MKVSLIERHSPVCSPAVSALRHQQGRPQSFIQTAFLTTEIDRNINTSLELGTWGLGLATDPITDH